MASTLDKVCDSNKNVFSDELFGQTDKSLVRRVDCKILRETGGKMTMLHLKPFRLANKALFAILSKNPNCQQLSGQREQIPEDCVLVIFKHRPYGMVSGHFSTSKYLVKHDSLKEVFEQFYKNQEDVITKYFQKGEKKEVSSKKDTVETSEEQKHEPKNFYEEARQLGLRFNNPQCSINITSQELEENGSLGEKRRKQLREMRSYDFTELVYVLGQMEDSTNGTIKIGLQAQYHGGKDKEKYRAYVVSLDDAIRFQEKITSIIQHKKNIARKNKDNEHYEKKGGK